MPVVRSFEELKKFGLISMGNLKIEMKRLTLYRNRVDAGVFLQGMNLLTELPNLEELSFSGDESLETDGKLLPLNY